ncbi:MAG: hypothetical protein BWY58_00050 [Chloroflexi bacterium ADurb.Bin344]|nr:MAG: hypothetical protein BWY58_00050 [Chloroflexi bacterium ADurb.Bin344]
MEKSNNTGEKPIIGLELPELSNSDSKVFLSESNSDTQMQKSSLPPDSDKISSSRENAFNIHLQPCVITDHSQLEQYADPIKKWIFAQTKGKCACLPDGITIVNGTEFFNYRFDVVTVAIWRDFEKKHARLNAPGQMKTGLQLDRSCLWTIRDDVFIPQELLKNQQTDISIRIADTASVIACPTCNQQGKTKCSDCNGHGKLSCGECNGRGSVLRDVEVQCPKCKGKGLYYNKTCDRCSGFGAWMGNTIAKDQGREGNRAKGKGTIVERRNVPCAHCDGAGDVICRTCRGSGKITCSTCLGFGVIEEYWAIHQKLHDYDKKQTELRDSGFPDALEIIPEANEKNSELLNLWAEKDAQIKNNIDVKIEGPQVANFSRFLSDIQAKYNSNYKVLQQSAHLYRCRNYVKVDFLYLGKTYTAWIRSDTGTIFEFQSDGICAAWNRARQRYADKVNVLKRMFGGSINYLAVESGDLPEDKKLQLSTELTPLNEKAQTIIQANKSADAKCVAGSGEIIQDKSKSRNLYIILSIFLPGIHSLYAGYKIRAAVQILLIILSFGILLPVVWLWAIIESHIIKKDAHGIVMRRGSFLLRVVLVVIILITELLILGRIAEKSNPQANSASPEATQQEKS